MGALNLEGPWENAFEINDPGSYFIIADLCSPQVSRFHRSCLFFGRHALDIREHYERKLERANNLYMELSAIMLQLEMREKELIKYVARPLSALIDLGLSISRNVLLFHVAATQNGQIFYYLPSIPSRTCCAQVPRPGEVYR